MSERNNASRPMYPETFADLAQRLCVGDEGHLCVPAPAKMAPLFRLRRDDAQHAPIVFVEFVEDE